MYKCINQYIKYIRKFSFFLKKNSIFQHFLQLIIPIVEQNFKRIKNIDITSQRLIIFLSNPLYTRLNKPSTHFTFTFSRVDNPREYPFAATLNLFNTPWKKLQQYYRHSISLKFSNNLKSARSPSFLKRSSFTPQRSSTPLHTPSITPV